MPSAKEIVGFVISLLIGIIPSVVILWRYNDTEKRKAQADTAVVYQGLANKCAEDLETARMRIEDLEDYNRQLIQVIRNQGGYPPPFKKAK